MSRNRPFAEPIELPKGKKFVTLRDGALYITKLPKAEHEAAEWQAVMECLNPGRRKERSDHDGAHVP